MNARMAAVLAASTDMDPVEGSVDVAVPTEVLWSLFADPSLWPRWNACICWAHNRDLVEGDQLVWCFNPLRRAYLYRMPAFAEIIDVEDERRVTWEVGAALPGFFAHHTYWMEDLGGGRTRFGSWEKACGESFRRMRRFWIAHFAFVRDSSLDGARHLEHVYRREGRLDASVLAEPDHGALTSALAAPIVWAADAARSYERAIRLTPCELAPGIHAVLGGCNSLVVAGAGEALVVDPKFPPFSWWLRRWIAAHVPAPVTHVVDTHHHWDHAQGNIHYPGAVIAARTGARALMERRDPVFWRAYPRSLPAEDIDAPRTLRIGDIDVTLHPAERAHTCVDLWAHVQRGDVEIVTTGDIAFHGCYPFLDTDEAGASLPGTIHVLRDLAGRYPRATFVPGHGPTATAADLLRHAEYLATLHDAVRVARDRGLSEDEAACTIDLSTWRLAALPIFHYGTLFTTARSNVRAAYRLLDR